MVDLAEDIDVYFRLLFYSELPTSPLRKPVSEWGDVEHVAAAMVELFALIDAVQFSYDYRAVAAWLANIERQQVLRFDAALAAIGNVRQRRLLALVQRKLVERVADLGPDERIDTLAAQIVGNDPALIRAKYDIDLTTLQRSLFDFLVANGSAPAALPPFESPKSNFTERRLPRILARKDARAGTRNVFLLLVDDATSTAVDGWLRTCESARHYDAKGSTPVGTFADIVSAGSVPMWGPLACGIVGEGRGKAPAEFLHDYWVFGRDLPQAESLDRIITGFRWALFQWGHVNTSSLLAFVSDDEEIADRFENLLQESDAVPLSMMRRAGDLIRVAKGIAFREKEAFGEAALAAAELDGCSPWILVSLLDGPGHWWRKTTSRLRPRIWHWTSEYDRPLLMLAYRDVDAAAWRELWSHLSLDDNVATAAISGRVPDAALRERVVRVKTVWSLNDLLHVAGPDGWVYTHAWGGGSDEHYALFYAANAAITARVGRFARRKWPELARYHTYW